MPTQAKEDLSVSDEAPVEPIESVDEAPKKESKGDICWNCKNHDPKTKNRLDDDGVCEVCGFDKNTLYNGNIEADKAGQRAEAARAAERGF